MKVNKKIILIANSEHTFDINQYITETDIIVRFNLPKSTTLTKTGQRTDILFLANSVDVVQKKLKANSKFIKFLQTINNPFTIIFPYSDNLIKINKPKYKKKTLLFFKILTDNFNNIEYSNFLKGLGYTLEILPDYYYLDLKKQVDPDTKNILSTGFLAANYFLNNPIYQDYTVYLHGFSFEGWDGHNWDKEKEYMNEMIKNHKIHIFPKDKNTIDSI